MEKSRRCAYEVEMEKEKAGLLKIKRERKEV